MPMSVISKVSSYSSTVFSLTSLQKAVSLGWCLMFGQQPLCHPCQAGLYKDEELQQFSLQETNIIFPSALLYCFQHLMLGKNGIKARKSQCLWMRFTHTPHLCSTWKNLTPQSLHIPELSSSMYELLISHIGYSKSLYCYTTFDSLYPKLCLCHLNKHEEKKKQKRETQRDLISYYASFFFFLNFPSSVIRVFLRSVLSVRLYHSTWQQLSGER